MVIHLIAHCHTSEQSLISCGPLLLSCPSVLSFQPVHSSPILLSSCLSPSPSLSLSHSSTFSFCLSHTLSVGISLSLKQVLSPIFFCLQSSLNLSRALSVNLKHTNTHTVPLFGEPNSLPRLTPHLTPHFTPISPEPPPPPLPAFLSGSPADKTMIHALNSHIPEN